MKIAGIRLKVVLLYVARGLGLFSLARVLTRHKLRILCYHGGKIGDESDYNPKLFCSAATLRRRMQWMRKRGYRLVSLEDALGQSGPVPSTAGLTATITLDDGWYSSASKLVPVLGKMGIPSTIYLSTQQYLKGWPILSVTVRYMLWKAGAQVVTISDFAQADGKYDLSVDKDRNRLANAIGKQINDSAVTREDACNALYRLADCIGLSREDLQLDTRRFDYVTSEELLALPAQGCQVELHGHVHCYPTGDPLEFAEDLKKCMTTIVEAGLPTPRHYCYPSGSFDAEAEKVLDRMGVYSGTTCLSGLVDHGTSRYYLPRFLDGEDVHELEFEAEMSGLLDLARRGLAQIRGRFSKTRRRSVVTYAGM